MSTTTLKSPAQVSPNGDSARELAAELARLRERFVAYERLDQQLDEMVTGLTDLLRGATELRRRTNQDIAAAIARCEELIVTDRAHHRATLATLLADLDATQRRTTSLTTAIADLQTQLAAITNRLPAPSHSDSNPRASRLTPHASQSSLTLLIRDVPSVGTALTLQRVIAGLAPVTSVQTREFAGGELTLRLDLNGPFAPADLGLLPNGTFAVIDEEPDRLVLRYVPPAAT